MTDLDFDELDRAVNSLIGGPVATTPNVGVTPVVPTEPVVVNPTPIPSAQSLTPTQPLAARRSSGRFMDVVHPSSDMRSTVASIATVTPVVTPISNNGTTIEPYVTSAETAPTSPSLAQDDKPASDWPDPLDFQAFKPGVNPATSPVTTSSTDITSQTTKDDDADISKIADEINSTISQETTGPLESPFLTDTKVEKRPLGAFSSTENQVTTLSSPAAEYVPSSEVATDTPATTSEDKTLELDDHPIGTEVPLPAELQSDLLSIEANEDPAVSAPEASFIPPRAPSTDVATGDHTSITQQYTEQPSTSDKPVGTIFDTEAYKKPVVHSKKSKPKLFVVLWIVLLVIVGAGTGAAIYFFVLPTL